MHTSVSTQSMFKPKTPAFGSQLPIGVYAHLHRQQPEVVRGFLRASARGFQAAAQRPAEAADALCQAAPALDRRLACASQEYVSKVQAS